MGKDPMDGILPDYAIQQIRIRARSLIGQWWFTQSDLDDIMQQLRVEVWRRLPKFNPGRGDFERFIYHLVRKATARIVESQIAAKRLAHHRTLSADSLVKGKDSQLIRAGNLMDADETNRRLGTAPRHFTDQSDLKADVRDFLGRLPADLHGLCKRLMDGQDPTEIHRLTGMSRGSIYDRREKLRQLMEQAGLKEFVQPSGASTTHPVDDQ
jgi:RNA polymerase sigma-70 factor (ECF subfamily)